MSIKQKYFIIKELCSAVGNYKVGDKVHLDTKEAQLLLKDLQDCPYCKVAVHKEHN